MSTLTADNIFILIKQLPSEERARLNQLLAEPPVTKAPLDKRVPCEPMRDFSREWQWIAEHKHEYAGQWVALEGDQLVAASHIQQEVWEALKTASAKEPLVHRISSPEDLPYIGI